MQPFDVLKSTLQKNRISTSSGHRYFGHQYFNIAGDIIKTQGIQGIYRGYSVALLRSIPGHTFYLTSLEKLAPIVRENFKNTSIPTPILNLSSAMSVRGLGTIIFMPLSLAKTRRESGLASDINLASIKKQFKISLVPSILRDSGSAGVYYMFYNFFKEHSNKNNPSSKLDFTIVPLISATLSTILTQPLDVIASQRMMANKKIVVSEVVKNGNLFVGLGPRILRKSASNTVLWLSFEWLNENL